MSDAQIRPYYKEYFGEDRATDVIAFPLEDEELLGSIVVSIETAERQAKEHGKSLWEEVRFLIIHGFLHLLGYDHGEEEEKRVMQAKEQELLALTESI